MSYRIVFSQFRDWCLSFTPNTLPKAFYLYMKIRFYHRKSSVLLNVYKYCCLIGTDYDVRSKVGDNINQPFEKVVDPMPTDNNSSLNSLAAQSPSGNGSGWLMTAVCYWAIASAAAAAVFDGRS